jgi:hypothetical protein
VAAQTLRQLAFEMCNHGVHQFLRFILRQAGFLHDELD